MIDIDKAIEVLQAVKAGKKVMFRRSWKTVWYPIRGIHNFDFTNNVYEIFEEEQRSSPEAATPKPAPVSHYERVKPRIRTLPYGYIQNDAGRVFS